MNCRVHCTYMKTMFFERLAQQYKGKLSLVHAFPGTVVGPSYWESTLPWWFRTIWWAVSSLVIRFLATPPDESGQRTLFYATSRYPARGNHTANDRKSAQSTNRVSGGGAYSCGPNNEPYNVDRLYAALRRDGLEHRVWDHTIGVFDALENYKSLAA